MKLSDYFLAKYVKEQQERFESQPQEELEKEPSTCMGKNMATQKELEKHNKYIQLSVKLNEAVSKQSKSLSISK